MAVRFAVAAAAAFAVITAGHEHDHGMGIGLLGGVKMNPLDPRDNGSSNVTIHATADRGAEMAKQIMFPLVALVAGALMLLFAKAIYKDENSVLADVGKLVLYFGAQTGMNLYMKAVLSSSMVSEEDHLHGMPAGFACTAVQQVTAFILFGSWILISNLTGCGYEPKRLDTKMEMFAVICFSLSFTLNIALNNYSLSLIPISTNLIIRSCLPLSTFLSSYLVARLTKEEASSCKIVEILLMVLGVICAAVVCYAEHAGEPSDDNGGAFVFGVIVCCASLLSGSLNMALAQMLGTTVKLNPLDTTVYMSVPAVIFLIVPVFFYTHLLKDKAWQEYMGSDNVTDWSIFASVWQLSPFTVFLAVFSGALALAYNVLQYGLVQSLSAAHTTFAGNFNKAATIVLSLLVGLETLPEGMWGTVMLFGVVGNIGAFTVYNVVKLKAKDEPEEKELLSDDDGYDSEDAHQSS